MSVVMLKYKPYLLTGSPVEGLLIDDPTYDGWDINGGQ